MSHYTVPEMISLQRTAETTTLAFKPAAIIYRLITSIEVLHEQVRCVLNNAEDAAQAPRERPQWNPPAPVSAQMLQIMQIESDNLLKKRATKVSQFAEVSESSVPSRVAIDEPQASKEVQNNAEPQITETSNTDSQPIVIESLTSIEDIPDKAASHMEDQSERHSDLIALESGSDATSDVLCLVLPQKGRSQADVDICSAGSVSNEVRPSTTDSFSGIAKSMGENDVSSHCLTIPQGQTTISRIPLIGDTQDSQKSFLEYISMPRQASVMPMHKYPMKSALSHPYPGYSGRSGAVIEADCGAIDDQKSGLGLLSLADPSVQNNSGRTIMDNRRTGQSQLTRANVSGNLPRTDVESNSSELSLRLGETARKQHMQYYPEDRRLDVEEPGWGFGPRQKVEWQETTKHTLSKAQGSIRPGSALSHHTWKTLDSQDILAWQDEHDLVDPIDTRVKHWREEVCTTGSMYSRESSESLASLLASSAPVPTATVLARRPEDTLGSRYRKMMKKFQSGFTFAR